MIFVVNSGSSSLKFRLYTPGFKEMAQGLVERIGLEKPFLNLNTDGRREHIDFPKGIPDHRQALRAVIDALRDRDIDISQASVVGHRVVHGGEEFTEPTVVYARVFRRLQRYSRLAPLHNPANLSGIDSCRALLPKATNVAVFDTAFYRTIPDHAFMYALPWEYYRKHGIRKYGFHGISHRYVTEEAARILGRPYSRSKFVSCHLGSGSSVTAVRHGKAVDTTMGFTPLEGLTMSTRCGDIDPSIPLYLIRTFKMSEREVDELLNTRSGLLGISGFKDLRDVLSAAGHRIPGYRFTKRVSPERRYRSKLAIRMFCYDVARYIGAYVSLMGGADAVIFTAGIGERSDIIRDMVTSMVSLPPKTKVMVVPTNEELMIARQARAALRRRQK